MPISFAILLKASVNVLENAHHPTAALLIWAHQRVNRLREGVHQVSFTVTIHA